MVMPYQWPQMARALGQPELTQDPRFKSPRDRRANKEALGNIIEAWMSDLGTRDAALDALRAERVPCAPVLTLDEAIAHPHLLERGTVRAVNDPLLGDFAVPGMPAKFSAYAAPSDPKAPLLGQDNDELLSGILGMDEEEITALYDAGTIRQDRLIGAKE